MGMGMVVSVAETDSTVLRHYLTNEHPKHHSDAPTEPALNESSTKDRLRRGLHSRNSEREVSIPRISPTAH